MKIYFLSQESPRTGFTDEEGGGSTSASFRDSLGTAQQWWGKPEEGGTFLRRADVRTSGRGPTPVFGEPSGVSCVLVPLGLGYAASIIINIPLAVACKLPEKSTMGLMAQKLTVEGTKAAKMAVICFPFWNSPKKELRKGWGEKT